MDRWTPVKTHRTGAPRPVSGALRRRLLQCRTGALDIAREQGSIDTNPCRGVIVPRAHRREACFLTVTELRQLVRQIPEWWQPLVWLLGACGLRIGEAAALRMGASTRLEGGGWPGRREAGFPFPRAVQGMLPANGREPGEPLFLGERGFDVNVWRVRVWKSVIDALGLGRAADP
ncbi:MAG: hypothetical protein Q4D89_04435 [Arachnia propionica]|uniref:hypothetical protein n=1 Tax=Arachnia propionica TaxID=1750 RepID=UPI0026F53740|nr:hypothetical protein [Arachnia propionica]